MRSTRYTVTTVVAVVAFGLLSACSGGLNNKVPMPVPTASTSASPSASAVPDPDPTLLPGGTALANKVYFDFVNARLLAVNVDPSSDAIVQNLVNAGFALGEIEVTPDKTSELRRPADSIEFSVKTTQSCLLGQFQSGIYRSTVGAVSDTGTCLIGLTSTNP